MCNPRKSFMLVVMQSVQHRHQIRAFGSSVFSVAFSLVVILLLAMEDMNHTETKGVPSFAQGLQILLIDQDSVSLMYMASILEKYSFKVTTTALASVALSMIREQKDHYQLVMANINMPDTDRDSFLSLVHKKDIPVILMSSEMNVNVARKALAEGACFVLEKPVSVEDMKNVWQHAYRKIRNPSKVTHERNGEKNYMNHEKGFQDIHEPPLVGSKRKEFGGVCRPPVSRHNVDIDTEKIWTRACKSGKVSVGDGNHKRELKCSCIEELITTESQEQAKNEEGIKVEDNNGSSNDKKSRFVWTPELHLKFTAALSALGDKKAHPKLIHKVMNVTDVTVRQVASHLQKYKNQVKRMFETSLHSLTKPSSFNIRNEFPPAKLSSLVSQYEQRKSRFGIQGNTTGLITPNSLMRPPISSSSFNNHHDYRRHNLWSGHHGQYQNLNPMRKLSRFSYGAEMNGMVKKSQPLGLTKTNLPNVNYATSEFSSPNISENAFPLPSDPPVMNQGQYYTPAWNAPINSQNLNQFSTEFAGPTDLLDPVTEQTFFGNATNPEKLTAGFNDTTAISSNNNQPLSSEYADLLKLLEENPIESNCFVPATNPGEADLLKLLGEDPMGSNCLGNSTNAGDVDRYCEWLTKTLFENSGVTDPL